MRCAHHSGHADKVKHVVTQVRDAHDFVHKRVRVGIADGAREPQPRAELEGLEHRQRGRVNVRLLDIPGLYTQSCLP